MRVAKEPPFRLFCRAALKCLPTSVHTQARWDIGPRPNYLVGVLGAAQQAQTQGVVEITVMEIGVACGNGLLGLQDAATRVEAGTGIRVSVLGFDTGGGVPKSCGDYRDHPDHWVEADYPMDVEALRQKLLPRTRLVLGDVEETMPKFVIEQQSSPIGFMSIDVDYYSSDANCPEGSQHAGREDAAPNNHVFRRRGLFHQSPIRRRTPGDFRVQRRE